MADQKKSEIKERTSNIGVFFLLLVLGFALIVWLDAFGIGMKLGKLINIPLTRNQQSPNTNAAPAADVPALSVVGPITQAWYVDASGYSGADAERKTSGAPMLIFFHKRPCEACRRVDHELFAVPDVKRALEGFVRVRIDTGAGEKEMRLAEKFGVADFPALVSVDSTGATKYIPLKSGGATISAAQLVAGLR